MKIYLVGGAIRDKLLGIPVKEKDWVVVGSTPEEMHKKGYKQVGKDFPVFIDSKTGEEYALARTERKSGHGYTGFEFDSNPKTTSLGGWAAMIQHYFFAAWIPSENERGVNEIPIKIMI